MHSTLDIDQIVREVLRRLAQEQGGHAQNNGAVRGKQPQPPQPSGTLVLEDRLLTVAQLDGRLNGIRRLKVSSKAVVTPAVRDLLREKKIELEKTAGDAATRSGADISLVIGAAENAACPAEVVQGLRATGVHVAQLARSGMASILEEVAEEVCKGGSLGLLLTSEPLVGVCLANRKPGARAAWAGCVKGVQNAKKQLGVNLLVVNPSGKSTAELKQMLSEFCRDGVSPAPARWKQLL